MSKRIYYDQNGREKGHSHRDVFGTIHYYDKDGNKTGKSRKGFTIWNIIVPIIFFLIFIAMKKH